MAASSSASLSSAFNLYTPQRFSRSSSRPTNHLPQQFIFTTTRKPFSRTPFSSYPILNTYRKFGDSRNINDVCRIDKRSSLTKPSVSAWQQNQPQQMNNEEGSDSVEFRAPQSPSDKKFKSRLKPIMQAYKEAILYRDAKTMYEVEDIIYMLEKEKYELDQKVLALSAEASSGKEKYLRVQADFDNYRKRVENERLNVRNDAKGDVIESLLPMVDSFERAKQQLKIETEMEKKIDTSYQGIYKQFVEIMRSLRVSAVPTVGKPFDPMMHEAIAREESHEFKEGIIIQEFRRGFYLGDRLLRPAMVKVSAGLSKRKPSSVQEVTGVDNRL